MAAIQVLVVDEETLFREGLCAILENQDQIVVVGDSGDLALAVRMAVELQPDVILLDWELEGTGGAIAIERLLAAKPTALIILLATREDSGVGAEAKASGVQGYLLKSQRGVDAVLALRTVASGQANLDPSGRPLGGRDRLCSAEDTAHPPWRPLSSRCCVWRRTGLDTGTSPMTVDMSLLLEGDADGDNRVRSPDFALRRSAYFSTLADPESDPRADFDEDGRIRSSDFALLRGNYFASRDIEVTAHAAAWPGAAAGTADIALEPARVTVEAGETFTLTLMAHSGDQAFVGPYADIHLPGTYLEAVGTDDKNSAGRRHGAADISRWRRQDGCASQQGGRALYARAIYAN